MVYEVWPFKFYGLNFISKKYIVNRLFMMEKKDEVCEGYILKKHHKNYFLVGKSWRTKESLKILHVDIYM